MFFLARTYSTLIAKVPGARFIPQFLGAATYKQVVEEARNLNNLLITEAKSRTELAARSYLSKYHNLPSEEYYKLVQLKEQDGRCLQAQYFEKYGETGHKLTYFIGKQNIPSFVMNHLIHPMAQLEEVASLKSMPLNSLTMGSKSKQDSSHKPLDWNFTFNVYSVNPECNTVAGFPFHIDIAANGEITAICTLISSALLQMRRKGESNIAYSVNLTPGSLFLLSGEARWEWEHRVLPHSKKEDLKYEEPGEIKRMSLVLGCK